MLLLAYFNIVVNPLKWPKHSSLYDGSFDGQSYFKSDKYDLGTGAHKKIFFVNSGRIKFVLLQAAQLI